MKLTLVSILFLIFIQISSGQVEERVVEVLEGYTDINENNLEALIEAIEDSLFAQSNSDDALGFLHTYKSPIRISMISTYWRNFEEAIGFSQQIGGIGFVGKRYGFRNRCQVSGRNFKIKSVSESDPGESHGLNMDHRSVGIEIKPSRERFRLFFGDYNFEAGLGLGMSTRPIFNSWKGEPISMIKKRTMLGVHGGANENSFFRGGAAEFNFQRFKGIVFCSGKDLNTTLKKSEKGEDYFSGIYYTGLHRTTSELMKKKAVYEDVGGVVVEYAGARFEIGSLFSSFRFSEDFILPQSNNLLVEDLEYLNSTIRFSSYARGLIGNGMFTGELALSGNLRTALMVSYTKFERKGWSYMISLKNSDEGFFSHNTTVSSSFITKKPNREGRINVLFRYGRKWGAQTDIRIQGVDNAAFDNFGSSLKFRSFFFFDLKFLRTENHIQFQQGYIKTSLKIKQGDTENPFYWQGEIGVSSKDLQGLFINPGSYLSLRGRYMIGNQGMLVQGGISLFTSSSRNPPFYTYEPDVLYGMSLPALSGTGSRAFLLLNYNFPKTLSIQLKLARVDYDDRVEIGSGNDRIPTNHRTSIKVQLVYRSQT